MYKEIKKAGRDITVAALKSRNYTGLKKINDVARRDAAEVFTAVADGLVRVAWYDNPPVKAPDGNMSIMQYALHRSPKKDGFLQLSYMEIKDGRIIPCGDLQLEISAGSGTFFESFRDTQKFIWSNQKSSVFFRAYLRVFFCIILAAAWSYQAHGPRLFTH